MKYFSFYSTCINKNFYLKRKLKNFSKDQFHFFVVHIPVRYWEKYKNFFITNNNVTIKIKNKGKTYSRYEDWKCYIIEFTIHKLEKEFLKKFLSFISLFCTYDDMTGIKYFSWSPYIFSNLEEDVGKKIKNLIYVYSYEGNEDLITIYNYQNKLIKTKNLKSFNLKNFEKELFSLFLKGTKIYCSLSYETIKNEISEFISEKLAKQFEKL